LGLPVEGIEFVKNPQPRFPVSETSYEVFDRRAGQAIPDIFVAGWARQASTGLVGVARRDGTNGARALLAYLQTLSPQGQESGEHIQASLLQLSKPLVLREDLLRLEQIERERAAEKGLDFFKFGSNAEMLQAMGLALPVEK
jgi:ferredoxin/flavodoxin---NADP+ reductase